uniref:Uncharacterized protein n=1 Tax=Cannabis sativa TaxID=3483 RepID=A0A803QD29_CANSA
MTKIITDFYGQLFTTGTPSLTKIEELLQVVKPIVTEEMNSTLRKSFAAKEIRKAVFSMSTDKSLGLDGTEVDRGCSSIPFSDGFSSSSDDDGLSSKHQSEGSLLLPVSRKEPDTVTPSSVDPFVSLFAATFVASSLVEPATDPTAASTDVPDVALSAYSSSVVNHLIFKTWRRNIDLSYLKGVQTNLLEEVQLIENKEILSSQI